MKALGPRRREPESWQGWLGAALELIWRRIGLFGIYSVAVVMAMLAAYSVAWAPARILLVLLLVVISLVLFIRLALVADYNREPKYLYIIPGNLDVALAITVGAALFAGYGAFLPGFFEPLAESLQQMLVGLGLYETRLETGAPAPPPASQLFVEVVFMAGGVWGVAAFSAGLGLLAFGQWFLLPMVVLHASPVGMSMVTSLRAYSLNPVPMTGLLGILLVMLALVIVSLGWLAPFMLPVLGALLYTSYRDVFLERDYNHPPGPPVLTDSEA
ncbi:hypothetical protein LRD18_05645 [Halorhodospira halochloris]|uniref:Possible transmembrane protein n=1 Tax=Halorhodospira halochloris TaxID=1052 RepID=A0A0X8XA98_HALHR|nr:hypothetical protein [Halorhodospira halochloris]MBK1651943.1 hypothetical protein [Halorhodospira halochloris]MCG5530356.1 hypothetical protein [Halorhodospira halochloris]BAU58234.1 possible transmembrane protein [Halorhodospira halochloris]